MGVMNFYQVPGSIVIGVVGAALALWAGERKSGEAKRGGGRVGGEDETRGRKGTDWGQARGTRKVRTKTENEGVAAQGVR
eukprot:755094-Hanusia_phi.AAC.2